MTRTYLQQRWPCSSDWSDTIIEGPVTIKGDRLVLNGSIGPRVRSVTELKDGHARLTLPQAAEVYAPEGRFRFTG